MARVIKNVCDRCGKPIKYIGWTAFISKPKKVKIRKILNGNPTGYNYTDVNLELCRECTDDLDKFMFGAAIERSESRQKVVEK